MRDGDQTRRRAFREFGQPLVQRPQDQAQARRRGLQQRGQEDGELAKADAMLAQHAPGFLVQFLDLGGDAVAGQDPKRLDQPEGKATGQTGQRLVLLQGQQRLVQRGDLAVDEMLGPAADLVGDLGTGLLVDEDLDAGMQRIGALDQLADRLAAPHQAALFGIIHLGVGRVVETVRTQMEFGLERVIAGAAQHPGLVRRCGLVGAEAEALQAAGEFALDRHFALVIHFGHQALLLLEPAQKHGCAPVHKSLGQGRVQRVRQAVFYSARFPAPMLFVRHPARSLRDIGPGADICQPLRNGVDVASGPVDAFDGPAKPIRRDMSILQETEDPRQQSRVLHGRDPAEIGHPAHVPQQAHVLAAADAVLDLGEVAQDLQRRHVVGLAPAGQQFVAGAGLQAFDQPVHAAEIQLAVTPDQPADGGEPMVLQRVDQPLVQGLGLSSDTEGPGFGVPPCPAGDLSHLMGKQRADPLAVELVRGAEGHMLDVQVQAHADGVGGH